MVDGRIESMKDYLNPKKLQRSNIEYKLALEDFKKRKWEGARTKYKEYIQHINKIDADSYYELGICCYQMALKEEKKLQEQKSVDEEQSKKKQNKLFDESVKNLHNALKYEPKNALFQNKLVDAILGKKDYSEIKKFMRHINKNENYKSNSEIVKRLRQVIE